MAGLITYAFTKKGEQEESTPLERWARRCYFGKANEIPTIHWNSPNHADIALSELNACTLGATANIKFKTTRADYASSPKIGGLVNIETRTTLNFNFTLPQYSETLSSFHCILIAHRAGDVIAQSQMSGEVIANLKHGVPSFTTRASSHEFPGPSTPQRFPDYRPETLTISKRTQSSPLSNGALTTEAVTGSIELSPDLGKHNITSATLFLAYWPDRDIPSAVAEIVIQEENK
ncbi:hypothetical protein ACIPZF_20365 [Pseudomonas sp. NPDC089752]|uniref:hypothetical protein n=1 Tax=Pseudomonas sp. NPDC089752 TaxID=3364472 RepID=UPI003829BB1F